MMPGDTRPTRWARQVIAMRIRMIAKNRVGMQVNATATEAVAFMALSMTHAQDTGGF